MSDEAIRRAFAADGFVRIPRFFTATETAEIEHALQTYMQSDMLAAPGGFDGHNYACEVEGDPSTVWRISGINSEPLHALGRLTELFSLAVGAAAGSVAGDCAPGGRGSDAHYDVQFFDKMPGGERHTPPHQDGGYSDLTHVLAPVHEADYCDESGNCVVVLDDLGPGSGGLWYLRGSHRQGLRRHGAGVVSFSQAIPELSAEERRDAVPLTANRGDVIVHHCLTVHWAEVNRSRSSRRRTLGYSFKSDALKAIEQRIGSRDSRDLWDVPRAGLVEGGELVGREGARERPDNQ